MHESHVASPELGCSVPLTLTGRCCMPFPCSDEEGPQGSGEPGSEEGEEEEAQPAELRAPREWLKKPKINLQQLQHHRSHRGGRRGGGGRSGGGGRGRGSDGEWPCMHEAALAEQPESTMLAHPNPFFAVRMLRHAASLLLDCRRQAGPRQGQARTGASLMCSWADADGV